MYGLPRGACSPCDGPDEALEPEHRSRRCEVYFEIIFDVPYLVEEV